MKYAIKNSKKLFWVDQKRTTYTLTLRCIQLYRIKTSLVPRRSIVFIEISGN